ncbi:MAG TPA: PmoA family protein [bacterium]|nr:PmoA family protein [bacterium]HPP12373.1 PmoA family protein [bacterium]
MYRISLSSAHRPFSLTPVAIPWTKTAVTLTFKREAIPTQVDDTGKQCFLVFIPPEIPADGSLSLQVREDIPETEGVTTVDDQQGTVNFFVGEELFTSYHYGPEVVRPYLNPVMGPGKISLVRKPVPPGNPENLDHPHHRGIWVAHGDVNGTDNWSEASGHGWTVHQKFLKIVSGPVFGRLQALNYWVTADKKKILEEERTITVYALPADHRIIDHTIILRASEGEVVFKDTKESGLLSVRMNPCLEVRNGGRFENAHGGVNEKECWGQRAMWCDYYGRVEQESVGLAVFDHPGNFRYPTWWHIRNYGLMTANFLGLADFTGDKRNSGTYLLPAYQELKLSYRLLIHRGTTREANIRDRYLNYLFPPEVSVT